MLTINQVSNHLLCPILSSAKDINISSLSWPTFDVVLDSLKDDYLRFLNVLVYITLLELLKEGSDNVVLYKDERPLQKQEKKFNTLIWNIFPSNTEHQILAAKAWVKLVLIYKKIVKISSNYSYAATNLVFTKRIFRDNPQIVGVTLPILFGNQDGLDALIIVPENNRLKGSYQYSLYNYFLIDYLIESGVKIGKFIEISYDRDGITSNFKIVEYGFFNDFFKTKNAFFDNLVEPKRPNINYCHNCFYENKCNLRVIK
jgi:hypothetical protein